MAIVFDGTNKRFAERLDDLEGEVFGPDGSAYRLKPRVDDLAAALMSGTLDAGEPDTVFGPLSIVIEGGAP